MLGDDSSPVVGGWVCGALWQVVVSDGVASRGKIDTDK